MMQSAADARQRPVVLDTGKLRPRGSRHPARVILDVAVAVVLGAGAIAAGGWSIMTAAQPSISTEQPLPLWHPASPPAAGAPGPEPGTPRPTTARPTPPPNTPGR